MRPNKIVTFDDRLATVLAVTSMSERDRAVRWRQLVDLVSRAGSDANPRLLDAAIAEIRAGQQGVAEPLRLAAARSIAGRDLPQRLLEAFAADTLAIAAPLLVGTRASAALREAASPEVRRFLEALHPAPAAPLGKPAALPPSLADEGPDLGSAERIPSIDNLVSRIERLLASRRQTSDAIVEVPAEPDKQTLDPEGVRAAVLTPATQSEVGVSSPALFRWECGPGGDIGWIDGAPRGALIGRSIALASREEGVDEAVERAFARRSPFRDATLSLPDSGVVSGRWLISGIPAFAPTDGRFVGYRGVARRTEETPAPRPQAAAPLDAAALRELVHEIKTPLNAIIGFAEIIDGQYLGPAQSGYRARAAEIVEQARVLLAAVNDLDLAARHRWRSPGEAPPQDLASFFGPFSDWLQAEAHARGVTLVVEAEPREGLCTVDRELAERLLDRFAAAVLAAAAPGETLTLSIRREQDQCALRITRPRALDGLGDAFLFGGEQARDGPAAALRLAGGLAKIAGSDIRAADGDLILAMPILR